MASKITAKIKLNVHRVNKTGTTLTYAFTMALYSSVHYVMWYEYVLLALEHSITLLLNESL